MAGAVEESAAGVAAAATSLYHRIGGLQDKELLIQFEEFMRNYTRNMPGTMDGSWNASTVDPLMAEHGQVLLALLYTLTTLLAVSGNLLIITVLLASKRPKTDLTLYLINLAAADLMMAVFCMPFTFTQVMLGRWVFGGLICPSVLFIQVLSVAVSIFTNIAIGIDRLYVVVRPLRQRLARNRSKPILLTVWLMAATLASPQIKVATLEEEHYSTLAAGSTTYFCNERWWDTTARFAYTICIALLTYLLPLVVLVCAYTKVGMHLWYTQTPGNPDKARDLIILRNKRKIVKMAITIVVVFAVCWLPLQLFNVILDAAPQLLGAIQLRVDEHLFYTIYYVCHWLAMANSFANPFIFGFLHEPFRMDLHNMCRRCCRKDSSSSDLQYSMTERVSWPNVSRYTTCSIRQPFTTELQLQDGQVLTSSCPPVRRALSAPVNDKKRAMLRSEESVRLTLDDNEVTEPLTTNVNKDSLHSSPELPSRFSTASVQSAP